MLGLRPVAARALGAALALCLCVPSASVFAQAADATIDMKNLAFAPTVIHIQPGQTVQWTNSDPLQHTVTADDGSFDSGLIDPGDAFTQEFDTPGTYQYYCVPHGSAGLHGMSATVIVDDPNAAAAGGE